MNSVLSFDHHIDVKMDSYNYKYSAPQYSPSTTASSSCYSVSLRNESFSQPPQQSLIGTQQYPLTLENLSKVQLADPSTMPLTRYCNELKTSASESVHTSSTYTTSTRRGTRKQQDKVIESPRILPFPYHNDSYFLPTAEHDYPGGSGSITDASSSIVNLSIHTMGSRQNSCSSSVNSLYHPQCGYQRQLLSSSAKSQFYSAKRYYDDDMMSNYSSKSKAASVTPLSSPTLRDYSIVPQKKQHRSNNRFASKFKQNLLQFKSNSAILECNSHLQESAIPPSVIDTFISPPTTNDASKGKQKRRHEKLNYNAATSPSTRKGVWFDKVCKFFKSLPFAKKDNSNTTATTMATTGPVWYSQYTSMLS